MKFLKSLFHTDTDDDSKGAEEVEGKSQRPLRPVIRVEPEEIKPIENLYRQLNETQMTLGQLQLNYERRKAEILDRMDTLQEDIESEVDELRSNKGIPEDNEEYSLNLPQEDGKHGYFLKDNQGQTPVEADHPEDRDAVNAQYDEELVVGD